MNDALETNRESAPAWYWHLPGMAVLVWWIFDLQQQWRSMVEYQFGWLVLLLSIYLVWDRFGARPRADRPAPVWLCGLLGVLGAPLVLLAELVKNSMAISPTTSFVLSLGCGLFLAANILFLYGPATLRHFLFPLLFLFVAVPLPPSIWRPIVLGLQAMITRLDVEALNLLGIPAVPHGNTIELPHCAVGVAEACSGIRSLQSSVMAGLFLGQLMLKRFSLRLVFLVLGVGLALVGNFLRTLYLSLAANAHGAEAIKSHDAAGWSILAFTAAGLLVLAWFMERLEKRADALPQPATPPARGELVK